eukprot:4620243-Amphidinium_carterae.1
MTLHAQVVNNRSWASKRVVNRSSCDWRSVLREVKDSKLVTCMRACMLGRQRSPGVCPPSVTLATLRSNIYTRNCPANASNESHLTGTPS